MSTERIDVLAVMDDAANAIAAIRIQAGVAGPGLAADLEEARAVVAELIDAAEVVWSEARIGAPAARIAPKLDRLRAALGRVEGAA